MAKYLPEDHVLFEILAKLPAKTLMRFKCVSKRWKTCISGDRYFIDGHRRQLQFSEDIPAAIILYNKIDDRKDEALEAEDKQVGPLTMVVLSEHFSILSEVNISYLVEENGHINFAGSCEGLVCVTCDEFPERVLLWNPATRQLRQLPCPPNVSDLWCVGFGLDDVSGDWKVVCLFLELDDKFPEESLMNSHVFAKSDTVWRDCGVSGIKGRPKPNKQEIPNAASGALHWKFSTSDGIEEDILSFDLNSEVLRFGNRPDCESFYICNWRSSLAAFTRDYDDDGMIESGYLSVASPSSSGEGLSWSKLLKLTALECERSFFVWRERFLLSHFDYGFVMSLVDPNEASNLKQLRFDLHTYGFLAFYDYVPTIIPVF